MNKNRFRELYNRIWRGDYNNIKFKDICDFVSYMGFSLVRQNGTSHKIFKMRGIADIINLQNDNGKAKIYQVKQIHSIIQKYKLGDDENECC